MRFIPGDIVQHPDFTHVGQVLSSEPTEETYFVVDLSTGKTMILFDCDEALVHYTDHDPDNPIIFTGIV